MPVFSVIIATYNRQELLARCLASFQNQTFKDFECIVVDRGSNPKADYIVDQLNDERFHYVSSSQDIHFVDVINQAVAKTRGKYFCVFGDDDLLQKESLDIVSLAFDKYADCDVVIIGSISFIPIIGKEKFLIPSHFSNDMKFQYFSEEIPVKKMIGAKYLKWILSSQGIGPEMECDYPSYIHPSTYFIRKGKKYENVVKRQGGISVRASWDAGYLGLVHDTNILYLNVPLSIVLWAQGNVSVAPRRFWNKETEDLKYMPKIAHVNNRGIDSLLNVIHLNHLQNEYDLSLQPKIWKDLFYDVVCDPIWDRQTYHDLKLIYPKYKELFECNLVKYIKKIVKIKLKSIKKRIVQPKMESTKLIDGCKVLNAVNNVYDARIKKIQNFLKE